MSVTGPLHSPLADPWAFLAAAVDGPLHPGGEAATDALLDRAGVGEETRLLDVGCGQGATLELARARGARAVGMDRRPSGTDVVGGDMTALPVRDGAVDVVVGECVLCLSPALDRTLGDVARTLRSGGRLACSDVTVDGSAPDLPAPIDELCCLDGARSLGTLRGAVEDVGFRVEDVRTHREDLLGMRDRIADAVDADRIEALLGADDDELRDGVADLDAAVESGRVGYASIVARKP